MEYQDDQFPETTRSFETTTYGVLIQKPQMERLCKNCRFWIENNDECRHPKNIYYLDQSEPVTKGMFCMPIVSGDFGCIYFEESK